MKIKSLCLIEMWRGHVESVSCFTPDEKGASHLKKLVDKKKKQFMKDYGHAPDFMEESHFEDSNGYECFPMESS